LERCRRHPIRWTRVLANTSPYRMMPARPRGVGPATGRTAAAGAQAYSGVCKSRSMRLCAFCVHAGAVRPTPLARRVCCLTARTVRALRPVCSAWRAAQAYRACGAARTESGCGCNLAFRAPDGPIARHIAAAASLVRCVILLCVWICEREMCG